MISIPANLGQRILEAARIAAAIHQEQLQTQTSTHASAGGAGAPFPLTPDAGNDGEQRLANVSRWPRS